MTLIGEHLCDVHYYKEGQESPSNNGQLSENGQVVSIEAFASISNKPNLNLGIITL